MPSPPPSSAVFSVTEPVSLIDASVLFNHLDRSYLEIVGGNISLHDPEALSKLNEWTGLAESYLRDPTEETYLPVESLGEELDRLFRDKKSKNVYFPEDDISEGLEDILEALEFPKIFHAYVEGLVVENGYHGGRGQLLQSAEEHLKSMGSMERDEKKNHKEGPWLSDIDEERLANALAMSGVGSVQLEFEAHRNLVAWIYAWHQEHPKVDEGEKVKRKRDENGLGDEVPPKEKKFVFRQRQPDNPA
ncbi:hypothetical protein FFLO_02642 [Filobasidium floriforme]|uniref:Uncharacterized protein n=1 Tax=Filobasidium floriforme TaxID=5210 RepID=A0A8K0JNR0_9TREE|nr:uncharacterized protein HD553DRAFT_338709 [Filobasidium floriforme]KAG7561913.1 hypothetical protein FFLO_02642 [Filobasidium floriforme]KAH8089394.1 hypothetical protein HD553DRAFT_338709 [Filobasidium floriforme]